MNSRTIAKTTVSHINISGATVDLAHQQVINAVTKFPPYNARLSRYEVPRMMSVAMAWRI